MAVELKSHSRIRAAKAKPRMAAKPRRKKAGAGKTSRAEVAAAFGKWLDHNIDHVNTWVKANTKKLTGKEIL